MARRPDAAGNARPKKAYIVHGGRSALLAGPLDLRTALGRTYRRDIEALTAHLGGEPSLPQQSLIEQAVRLNILASIAWGELLARGLFTEGVINPAFDALLRACKDERELLKLLGLERRAKDITDLNTYIEEHYGEDTDDNRGDDGR